MRRAVGGREAAHRFLKRGRECDLVATLGGPKEPQPAPQWPRRRVSRLQISSQSGKKSAVASLSFQQLSRPSSTPSPAPAFCENVETHGTNRLAAGEIGIEICVLDTSRIYPGRLIYCHSCFALGVFPKHALGRPGPAQHPGRRRLEFLAAWLSAKRVASAQGADGGVKR
jgi:hypothetical protein